MTDKSVEEQLSELFERIRRNKEKMKFARKQSEKYRRDILEIEGEIDRDRREVYSIVYNLINDITEE